MTKAHIQFAALIALTLLAGGLLFVMVYTFQTATSKMTPDGKVPIADAGLFTALLLSFQQVIGAMRSIWESQERTTLAEGLAGSTPTENQPAPKTAVAAAKRTAAAAQDEADHISDQAAPKYTAFDEEGKEPS